MSKRMIIFVVAAAILAVELTAAWPQQVVRRGSVAVVTADSLEMSLDSGVLEMTGNVNVNIKGDYTATMTAPSVRVETDKEKNQVVSIKATGPVTADVLTKPQDGKQQRIVARCSDEATFSEKTMIIEMRGNAHADVSGMPRGEGVESMKFDGDSMSINLKTHKVNLKQAHVNVEMAPPAEKPAAPEAKQ